MNGELLASDLKKIQGVKDALGILLGYTVDELEVSGSGYSAVLALANVAHGVSKLIEDTNQIECELIEQSGDLLKLRLEA